MDGDIMDNTQDIEQVVPPNSVIELGQEFDTLVLEVKQVNARLDNLVSISIVILVALGFAIGVSICKSFFAHLRD